MAKTKTIKADTDLVIMSVDTGVIYDEINEGDELKKIIPDEWLENHIPHFNEEKSFVKLYDDMINPLREYLTLPEFAFVISLSKFACYNDCVLRIGARKNGKTMTTTDMAEHMKMAPSTVRRMVSSLIDKGVMIKLNVGTIREDREANVKKGYVVNPHIFFRGTYINKTIARFFDCSGWKEKIFVEQELE